MAFTFRSPTESIAEKPTSPGKCDDSGVALSRSRNAVSFHSHAQRIAFRRRVARQQSRSFVPWNLIAETQPQLHSALLRLSADNFPGTSRAAVCVYSLFSATCCAGLLIWIHALTSMGPHSALRSVVASAQSRSPVSTLSPRRVFGKADRSGANRTSDRAGTAQR